MKRIGRKLFLTSIVGVVFAAGCDDLAKSITAPASTTPNIPGGVYRTTIWNVTDSGLQFAAATVGAYRTANGRLIVDTGESMNLSPTAVATLKDEIQTQTVIHSIVETGLRANNTRSQVSGMSVRSPKLSGGKTLVLPLYNGKRTTIDYSPNSAVSGQPPTKMIFNVDGRAVAVKDIAYKRTGNQWMMSRMTTSTLDVNGRPTHIVQTDLGNAHSSALLSNPFHRRRMYCSRLVHRLR